MKIKTDIEYKVFKEKVVVCNINYKITDIDYRCIRKTHTYNNTPLKFYYDTVEFDISAKAKCSPYDIFNLETGKRVAESRATIKAMKVIRAFLEDECNYYFDRITELSRYNTKVENILYKEMKHLNDLLND